MNEFFVVLGWLGWVVTAVFAVKYYINRRRKIKRIDEAIKKDLEHHFGSIHVSINDVEDEGDITIIKDARVHSISLVAEPPHPAWGIRSVERKVDPNVVRTWLCRTEECRTQSFPSKTAVIPKNRVGFEDSQLSRESCPECGARSHIPILTEVVED
jgi:hypothetical protein